MNKPDILNLFSNRSFDEESTAYLHTHVDRFAFNTSIIQSILEKSNKKSLEILDIGPSFFTEILTSQFQACTIYTLGFSDIGSRGGHFPEQIKCSPKEHFVFNLNDAQHREKWISMPQFDLVIFSEVVEHLYTSPSLVCAFLAEHIRPGGYLLLQTPNAISLVKRIQLLFGKHPYELIRENHLNPGHYREYAPYELAEILRPQFDVETIQTKAYFKRNTMFGKMYNRVQFLLPSNFRDGITVVARRKG